MIKSPPTPWVYMSKEFDDWGFIRNADGNLVAVAKWPALSADDLDLIRAAGDDPARDTAAFIIRACNAHVALIDALKEADDVLEDRRITEFGRPDMPVVEALAKIRAALKLSGEA